MPHRRQQTRKAAAAKETQPAPLRRESLVPTVSPTPDPALERINPIQKQQIRLLAMLAKAAEVTTTTTQLVTPCVSLREPALLATVTTYASSRWEKKTSYYSKIIDNVSVYLPYRDLVV